MSLGWLSQGALAPAPCTWDGRDVKERTCHLQAGRAGRPSAPTPSLPQAGQQPRPCLGRFRGGCPRPHCQQRVARKRLPHSLTQPLPQRRVEHETTAWVPGCLRPWEPQCLRERQAPEHGGPTCGHDCPGQHGCPPGLCTPRSPPGITRAGVGSAPLLRVVSS